MLVLSLLLLQKPQLAVCRMHHSEVHMKPMDAANSEATVAVDKK